jgi:hypothetical protein
VSCPLGRNRWETEIRAGAPEMTALVEVPSLDPEGVELEGTFPAAGWTVGPTEMRVESDPGRVDPDEGSQDDGALWHWLNKSGKRESGTHGTP